MPTTIGRELVRFVSIQPARRTLRRGVEATAAAATSVGVLSLAFGPRAALFGVTGAFVAFTGWDRPLVSRGKILIQLTLVYLVCVSLGLLVAGHPVPTLLTLGAVSVVVMFWYHALIADPPGPMLLIAGVGFASFVPTTGVPESHYLVPVVTGLVLSCLVCLLFEIPVRRVPLRDAVNAAGQAVDALADADPECTDLGTLVRLRDAAFTAHFHAQEMVVTSVLGRPTTFNTTMNHRLRRIHLRLIEAVCRTEMPWAQVEAQELLRVRYRGAPSGLYMWRWALSSVSLPWLAARRMGVAVVVSGATVILLGFAQPHWAVMTTAIILSGGADRVSTTHRGAQRLVGTVIGVFVFLVIESTGPSLPVVLAIVLACVFLVQILAPRNFTLASIAITPMALLLFTTGHPGDPGAVVEARLAETGIGVVSALLVLWATGFSTPVGLVRRQYRRVLRTLERTLNLYSTRRARTPLGLAARRNLYFEQLACVRILELARSDRPRTLAPWTQVEAVVSTLAYLTLAAGWTEHPEETLDTAAMASALSELLESLPPVSRRAVDADHVASSLWAVLAAGRAGRG